MKLTKLWSAKKNVLLNKWVLRYKLKGESVKKKLFDNLNDLHDYQKKLENNEIK